MGYPVGPLLQALARRVLANNELIEEIEHHSADPRNPDAFADTQLLISLLGVLVFPHEKASDLLGHLVETYPDVEEIVTIRFFVKGGTPFCQSDEGWEGAIRTFPKKDLPRYLRNSIAHFNILPIADG
jgi:hypothetical protein